MNKNNMKRIDMTEKGTVVCTGINSDYPEELIFGITLVRPYGIFIGDECRFVPLASSHIVFTDEKTALECATRNLVTQLRVLAVERETIQNKLDAFPIVQESIKTRIDRVMTKIKEAE